MSYRLVPVWTIKDNGKNTTFEIRRIESNKENPSWVLLSNRRGYAVSIILNREEVGRLIDRLENELADHSMISIGGRIGPEPD